MNVSLDELGIQAPEWIPAVRVGLRLLVAVALGSLIGWERERRGRAAGLRTHMLVALGAALLTAVPLEAPTEDPGRVLSELVRGIAPGIGFLGAGAILKMSRRREIKGLTTAAGIWATAAIGFTVGAGFVALAALATLLAWLILTVVGRAEPGADNDRAVERV